MRSARLILGGISVSKSIGLAYSWKEIYVSNLQEGFFHLSKTSNASTLSLWIEEIQAKSELRKQQ